MPTKQISNSSLNENSNFPSMDRPFAALSNTNHEEFSSIRSISIEARINEFAADIILTAIGDTRKENSIKRTLRTRDVQKISLKWIFSEISSKEVPAVGNGSEKDGSIS